MIEDQGIPTVVLARQAPNRSAMSNPRNGKPRTNGKRNGSTSMDNDEDQTWYRWESTSMKVFGATLLKEKDNPKFSVGLLNFELGFAFKPLVWEFSIKRSDNEWIGIGVVDSSVPLNESLRQKGSLRSKRDLAWFYHDRGFFCRGEHIEDAEVEPFQWDRDGICRIGVHFDYQNAELRFSCNGQDVRGKLDGVQGSDLYPAVYSSGTGTTFCCTAFPSQFGLTCRRSNFEGRNPPPVKPNLLKIAHESLEKQRRRENVWTNFNDENEEVRNEISTIDLEASQEVHLSSSLCMENGFEKSLKMLSEGFQTPLQSWTPNDSDSETPRADSNGSDVLVKTSVDSMADAKSMSPGLTSKKKLAFEQNAQDVEDRNTPVEIGDIAMESGAEESEEASDTEFDESEVAPDRRKRSSSASAAIDEHVNTDRGTESSTVEFHLRCGSLGSLTSNISKDKAKGIIEKISHLQKFSETPDKILEQILCAGLHSGGGGGDQAHGCEVRVKRTDEEQEPYDRRPVHVGETSDRVNASAASMLENKQTDYGGKKQSKTHCFAWIKGVMRTRAKDEETDYFCSDDTSR
uniref:B30.2/SPRY domain-containing protein n=1 Tax=Hanusia phi TaxID=3032 RepID=A0A7S0F2J6_9CRYP|mmetsp:Transcript_3588/g.8811  ORF Transcript_3588/g.8811 Transcript_3588/m.8811 type:complete len:574 (+) Transcript_3588:137-1858(+)